MSIDSDAENKLAKSLAEQSNGCAWIGLRFHKDVTQMEQLQWSDGASVNFTKWNVITPKPSIPSSVGDGNIYVCVFYDVQSTSWVNGTCSKNCSFVCKRKGGSK